MKIDERHRLLPATPVTSADDYVRGGGGRGLDAARRVDPQVVIAELEASGLRGRGGAGFPTGVKWRTVAEQASSSVATTVVVNAAEGEPGTFKDRSLLRANPYAVLEGALIAAVTLRAGRVIVATKSSFETEVRRVRAAIGELAALGWCDGVEVRVVEGPDEYLYGEETALLEVLDGRPPFPRVAPPYRRGFDEVVEDDDDATSGSGLSAHVEMAGPAGTDAPPALVDNVETMANVPAIVADGAAWFRACGTDRSPGTLLCTVTGAVQHEDLGEVAMGTPLREAIEEIGGGPEPGRRIVGVMTGVSSAVVPADRLDVPVTYEDFAAIGSGLGSASFFVIDDSMDGAAVAAGASRFLAVESCGQCTPCKQDGLEVSGILARLCANEATEADLAEARRRLGGITYGARCALAGQHQAVVTSLLDRCAADVERHLRRAAEPVEPTVVAELLDLAEGQATVAVHHRDKQPDWTYAATDSGAAPVDRLGDHRAATA
jgi:NADH:ubiquinone oxidoreductase subunit F (NADH-binding)